MRPPATAKAAACAAAVALGLAAAAAAADGFLGPTITNPRITPEFALRDQHGKLVDLWQQRGRVVLLTFLYTHCPDVCPLTAERLNRAVRGLGPRRAGVLVLAVSVDPVGDTKASVARFVRAHRLLPEFHYLTGTRATLAAVWRAYGVQSVARAGGGVDHTLFTLLLDRFGLSRVFYDSTATPAMVRHDVRMLLSAR